MIVIIFLSKQPILWSFANVTEVVIYYPDHPELNINLCEVSNVINGFVYILS